MSSEQTVKCPICGDPYKVYAFTVDDQSACPDCVAKAEKKSGKWQKANTVGTRKDNWIITKDDNS